MNKPYHLFISYATENEDYTSKLASHFQYLGLSVWFAPLTLKVGSKLLDSINAGLMASQYGLLILSPEYITKQWTTYEVDVLHRQHIEKDKKLFPIWHGVDKAKVDQWNLGISGIIALKSSENIESISKKIADVVYEGAPLRGITPSYENPQWRFLQGCGELHANSQDGSVFNLFEAVEFPDKYFPIYAHDRLYTRKELILKVASVLYYNNADSIQLTEDQRNNMKKLCLNYGYDIDAPEFDPATL